MAAGIRRLTPRLPESGSLMDEQAVPRSVPGLSRREDPSAAEVGSRDLPRKAGLGLRTGLNEVEAEFDTI